jgi:hypothetical protein
VLAIEECSHDHESIFYVQDDIGVFCCERCGMTTGAMPLVVQEENDG